MHADEECCHPKKPRPYRSSGTRPPGTDDQWLGEIIACLQAGKAVRREFAGGGRLHIDRPLPFLCVHIAETKHAAVAREITQSNASYLIAPDAAAATAIVEAVGRDPSGLSLAQNKLYFQEFPQAVRPTTLISKNIEEIRAFIDDHRGGVILKPPQGSGGKNVFKINPVTRPTSIRSLKPPARSAI